MNGIGNGAFEALRLYEVYVGRSSRPNATSIVVVGGGGGGNQLKMKGWAYLWPG